MSLELSLHLPANSAREVRLASIDPYEPTDSSKTMSYEAFFQACRNILLQANISGNVTVQPLGDYIGRVIEGRRTPFIVQTENAQYVLKAYQGFGFTNEKEVLAMLNGFHAPKPILLGDDLILEEFFDTRKAFSLANMFWGDRKKAFEIAGTMQARFAKKAVFFNEDMFFLRDLFLAHRDQKHLDFGTARLPFKMNNGAYFFDDFCRDFFYAHDKDRTDRFCTKIFLYSQEGTRPDSSREAVDALLSLNPSFPQKTNIYFQLSSFLEGMRKYIAYVENGAKPIASNAGMQFHPNDLDKAAREMLEIAPSYVTAFAKEYNSSNNQVD